MNEDFLDFLRELTEHGVRFLVVGAHALAVHGVPRATGDLDIWTDPAPTNARRLWKALLAFGAPVEQIGVEISDLQKPDRVVQVGLPPRRIDLLTAITAVDFPEAWEGRVVHVVDDLEVPFLGRDQLIQNKSATGRAKDLADLEELGASDQR